MPDIWVTLPCSAREGEHDSISNGMYLGFGTLGVAMIVAMGAPPPTPKDRTEDRCIKTRDRRGQVASNFQKGNGSRFCFFSLANGHPRTVEDW